MYPLQPQHPFIMKEEKPILDSGKRQNFNSGAVRDTNEGKGDYSLLPPLAIHRLAKHFAKGGKKYSPRNWEQGIPISRFFDSAMRHGFKYLANETDEDHGVSFLWNIICMIETEERIKAGILPPELDDLPKYKKLDEKQ